MAQQMSATLRSCRLRAARVSVRPLPRSNVLPLCRGAEGDDGHERRVVRSPPTLLVPTLEDIVGGLDIFPHVLHGDHVDDLTLVVHEVDDTVRAFD